jgi:hypothetical protein
MNNLWLLQDDIDHLEVCDIFPLNKDVILSKIKCLYDQLGNIAHLYDTQKINRDAFIELLEKENMAIFRILDIITPVFELKLDKKVHEVVKINKRINEPKEFEDIYVEFTDSGAWDIETKNLCAIYHGLNGYSIMIEICINQLNGYKNIEWWYNHTQELIIKENEEAIINEIEERTKKKINLQNNVENHILIQRLKTESPITYKAMCKALGDKFITFDRGHFDFHCDRGCVGLFFREGGFTEYKTLKEYIMINGNPPAKTTLENCTRNAPPQSWQEIKERYFDTPTK